MRRRKRIREVVREEEAELVNDGSTCSTMRDTKGLSGGQPEHSHPTSISLADIGGGGGKWSERKALNGKPQKCGVQAGGRSLWTPLKDSPEFPLGRRQSGRNCRQR